MPEPISRQDPAGEIGPGSGTTIGPAEASRHAAPHAASCCLPAPGPPVARVQPRPLVGAGALRAVCRPGNRAQPAHQAAMPSVRASLPVACRWRLPTGTRWILRGSARLRGPQHQPMGRAAGCSHAQEVDRLVSGAKSPVVGFTFAPHAPLAVVGIEPERRRRSRGDGAERFGEHLHVRIRVEAYVLARHGKSPVLHEFNQENGGGAGKGSIRASEQKHKRGIGVGPVGIAGRREPEPSPRRRCDGHAAGRSPTPAGHAH